MKPGDHKLVPLSGYWKTDGPPEVLKKLMGTQIAVVLQNPKSVQTVKPVLAHPP